MNLGDITVPGYKTPSEGSLTEGLSTLLGDGGIRGVMLFPGNEAKIERASVHKD